MPVLEDHSIFQRIKDAAHGLLPIEVYSQLSDLGHAANGGTFVEVGTAHGAATIALALGARAAKRDFHIYTVDPFRGKFSSRTKFGTVEQNIGFVRNRFKEFGVDENITIIPGSVFDLVGKYDLRSINILLIDADGCVDRDLSILFDKLASDCAIVIDDIDDWAGISTINGIMTFDQKHRLAHHLTKTFVAESILQEKYKIQGTGFYGKGTADVSSARILLSGIPAYRELVFAEIDSLPHQPLRLSSWIGETFPFARAIYRKLRRALKAP